MLLKAHWLTCFLLIVIAITLCCSKNPASPEENKDALQQFYSNQNWISDFGYADHQQVPITLGETGMPEIAVQFADSSFPLLFDYGTSDDLWITSELEDKVEHTVIGEEATLNADGSYRGTVKTVQISNITVLEKHYNLLTTMLADYNIFSNTPFNGAFGLKTLIGKRFTMDYGRKLMAYSSTPLPINTSDSDKYEVLSLVNFDYHPHGLHVLGEINGVKGIIHFDSGYNHSWVDTKILNANKLFGGQHQKYNGIVTVKLGNLIIPVVNPYAEDIQRDTGDYEYPTRFLMGSDILNYFIMTIDRVNDQNVMIIHK